MTTHQAAQIKGCHHQTIRYAIKRGWLTAVKFGRDWNVMDDEKFQMFQPLSDPADRIRKRWQQARAQQQQPIALGAAKGGKAKAKKGGKKA